MKTRGKGPITSRRTGTRKPKPRIRKAVTRDVVSPRGAFRIERAPKKWREHYERLSSLLDQLTRERGDVTRDLRGEKPRPSQQMAEAATDSYDQDWALSVLSSEQDAIYEIQEAMERMRQGTYGCCELTGKAISRERLRAVPWTRFSAEAEKQLEREGAARRTRLRPRETMARSETISRVAEEEP